MPTQEWNRLQEATATVEFLQTRQRHPGGESALAALQAGKGLARGRDRSRRGFPRYFAPAVRGRTKHTLGHLLIAQQTPRSLAARSQRKAA